MNTRDTNVPQPVDVQASELRGPEFGPQVDSAVDHVAHTRRRKPDQELRLDGEADTLYDDGLEIDSQTEPLAGTDGPGPKGIKG